MSGKTKESPGQEVIAKLLEAATENQINKALIELENLCKKEADNRQAVVADLAAGLQDEKYGPLRRTLLLRGLGKVGGKDEVAVVAQRLKEDPSERVRCRAATVLARLLLLSPPDLKNHLQESLSSDESAQVKATALRLLIENGLGQEKDEDQKCYLEQLIEMLTSSRVTEQWAAYRALRVEVGYNSLPKEAEVDLIQVMIKHLADEHQWRDIRVQAAQALGDVKYKKLEGVRALSETLKWTPHQSIRRSCIHSLAQLYDPEEPHNEREVKEALLLVLRDDKFENTQTIENGEKDKVADNTENDQVQNHEVNEVQILHHWTIEALKKIATDDNNPIDFIIEDLLRHEDLPVGYLEALRRIDNEYAAESLSNYLLHPDPKIVEQASKALTELGGVKALRTLQAQRSYVLNQYTKLLNTADKQIMGQFETLMGQAGSAFNVSLCMHITIFLAGIIILVISFALAVLSEDQPQHIIGTAGTGMSLATLLGLFYRAPFKNIGHSVNRLVRVNVVFLGYVRQINQIDVTFKQIFLNTATFEPKDVKDLVDQIQKSVEEALHKIKVYILDEGREMSRDECKASGAGVSQ